MSIRTLEDFKNLAKQWKSDLIGRSLIVEANIPADLASQALKVLAQNVRKKSRQTDRERLLGKYPAVLAAGLCAVASAQYESGAFWPYVPAGLADDANRQRETGVAFRNALSRLGLSRFTTPHKFVGEILMHAGVPLSSVHGLVDALRKWDDGTTSGDAPGFIRWTTSMNQQVAVTRGFDVPTYRFIKEGGEVAEDFIERVLETIDVGGTSSDLPPAIFEAVSAALEHQPASSDTLQGRRRRGVNAPVLTYDPHYGVRIKLPDLELEIEDSVLWTIVVDGEASRISVPAPWPGDPVAPKWSSIRSPQRSVNVGVLPGNHHWNLDIIDSTDPLLVFDGTTGNSIPPRTSVPRAMVWLAFPSDNSDHPESKIDFVGDLKVIERGAAPHGWTGWAFVSVDAARLEKFRLDGANSDWRYISTVERPRLVETEETVPYLTTIGGASIHGQRPRLILPGVHGEGVGIEWSVLVSDPFGREITRASHLVSGGPETVDLWSSSDPILGEFVITVRGPLGRGATLRVAVAEQITAVASRPFRAIFANGEGIEPATILVSQDNTSRQWRLSLGPNERQRRQVLGANGQSLQVLGEIPYLGITVLNKQQARESIAPVTVNTEDLPETILQVRVPKTAREVTAHAVQGGEVLQSLDARGSLGSALRTLDLAPLSRTLESTPAAQLRLVMDTHSAPVAFLRPRRLVEQAKVDERGILRLTTTSTVEGLVAHIYPDFAPWLTPYRLDIPSSDIEIQLPEKIQNEGSAVITFSVENPWVQMTPPRRPDRLATNSIHLRVGNLVDSSEVSDRGFRPWLAGTAPCPSNIDSLPRALEIYSLLKSHEQPELREKLRSEIAASVRTNRTKLLDAVLQTDADLNDLMRLLIEGDVVTIKREDWKSSEELWSLAPGLGVIADTDDIGTDSEPEFRANLMTFIGAEGISVLDTGFDPAAKVGAFDQGLDSLCRLPQEGLDALILEAGIIPQALLDRDSRVLATFQLLSVHKTLEICRLREVCDYLLERLKDALKADFGEQVLTPIRAREFRPGFGNIPALSLTFALAARAVARSKANISDAYTDIPKWFAKLASVAPRIVRQDLALAELWITHWEEDTRESN